jgi:hypothetical protein
LRRSSCWRSRCRHATRVCSALQGRPLRRVGSFAPRLSSPEALAPQRRRGPTRGRCTSRRLPPDRSSCCPYPRHPSLDCRKAGEAETRARGAPCDRGEGRKARARGAPCDRGEGRKARACSAPCGPGQARDHATGRGAPRERDEAGEACARTSGPRPRSRNDAASGARPPRQEVTATCAAAARPSVEGAWTRRRKAPRRS